ncbi:SMI1/KNR4 family protein [Cardiobacteriaceae bacterium TAE3-ERU3]|nr:SMI1/KNR4 family protein [Cardiobacteriaceae bacterium TAE3-ERU3]
MKSIWQRILDELQHIAPAIHQSINPAASTAEIAYLENTLDVSLPDDFKAYLATCNGQQHNHYEHLAIGYNALLPIDDIIANWQMMNELFANEEPIDHLIENKIKPLYWSPRWIPFSDYEASTRLILDLDPGKNGTHGQIFRLSPATDLANDDTIIATSFAGFSQRILNTLRERQYTLEDGVLETDWLL